jgi:hypothetical protein
MSTKPAVRLHLDREADHARLVVEDDGKTLSSDMSVGQLQNLATTAHTIAAQLQGQQNGRGHDIKNMARTVALEWTVLEDSNATGAMIFAFRTATGWLGFEVNRGQLVELAEKLPDALKGSAPPTPVA